MLEMVSKFICSQKQDVKLGYINGNPNQIRSIYGSHVDLVDKMLIKIK